MRLLYTIVVYLLSPFVLIRLFWLGFKNPEYWSKWNERLGVIKWDAHRRKFLFSAKVSISTKILIDILAVLKRINMAKRMKIKNEQENRFYEQGGE